MTTAEKLAHQAFTEGSIPPGYAKVIDVGPEGETNEPRIMPADVACRDWSQPAPKANQRVVIVSHPFGSTAIYWDDEEATVQSLPPWER